MSKKILGIILIIAVVAVVGVVYLVYQGGSENGAGETGSENLLGEGAVPGEGENTGVGIPQEGEQTGEKTGGQTMEGNIKKGNISKMNDGIYVEIMAHTGYYV